MASSVDARAGRATLSAGLARVEITPTAGTDMGGFAGRNNPAIGVHDPLYCRALVLAQKGRQYALLACDTVGFGLEYTRDAKREIEAATGIPARHIVLTSTHTHSGPASMHNPGCGTIALDWLLTLPAKLSEAVVAAQRDLSRVRIAVGRSPAPGVAMNRRKPGGPVDDELQVVLLEREDGGAKGAILHFACHPVALGPENLLFSADYAGAACRLGESLIGAPCIFLQGPGGNIDPVHGDGSFAQAEALGAILAHVAADVVASHENLTYLNELSLAASSCALSLPLGPLPTYKALLAYRDEHERQQEVAQSGGCYAEAKAHANMAAWARQIATQYGGSLVSHELRVELQCFRAGELYIVAVPGELFVEYGLQAKRRLAGTGKHILLLGYANGEIGYISDASSYGEGGYEVDRAYRYYAYPAPIAPEAAGIMQSAIKGLIEEDVQER